MKNFKRQLGYDSHSPLTRKKVCSASQKTTPKTSQYFCRWVKQEEGCKRNAPNTKKKKKQTHILRDIYRRKRFQIFTRHFLRAPASTLAPTLCLQRDPQPGQWAGGQREGERSWGTCVGSFQEHHGSRGRSRCGQEPSFSVPLLMK